MASSSVTTSERGQLRYFILVFLLLSFNPTCNGFSSVPTSTHNGRLVVFPRLLHARNSVPLNIRSRKVKIPKHAASQTADQEEETVLHNFSNYHLVWSPNFVKKMLLSSAFFWIAFQKLSLTKFIPSSYNKINTFLFNALLPTLSSACCWIQILLNTLSAMGCAGFNTYLGPIRPYFLALLAYLTITTRAHQSIAVSLLRWTIALLPECLYFWNNFQANANAPSTATAPTATSPSQPDTPAKTTNVAVYLDCPTMGCVACIQKVNSSLHKALQDNGHEVQKVDSWLLEGSRKGGKAKIRFAAQQHREGEEEAWSEGLARAVSEAGFPCTVTTVRSG